MALAWLDTSVAVQSAATTVWKHIWGASPTKDSTARGWLVAVNELPLSRTMSSVASMGEVETGMEEMSASPVTGSKGKVPSTLPSPSRTVTDEVAKFTVDRSMSSSDTES